MLSIDTDGYTRPCCGEPSKLARISDIKNGIKVSFDHPKLLKLRKDLETGFNSETEYACSRCAKLESNGESSLRTNTKLLSETRELKLLQFKMSNKCQLTCAHCGPELSSGWAKLLNIRPHVQNSFEVDDKFIEELKSLLPQLTVLKFSGGEPFLDPNHWKILDALKECDRSSCELEYITNGLVQPRYDLWKGWKNIKCSVSVDGFEESFEWFRRGANWKELLDAVKILADNSEVSINYSMTPYTIQDYHKSKNFWKYSHSTFPIVSPVHASLMKFPKNIIEKIPDYQTIPYSNLCSENNNLHIFKTWAQNWDRKWNTIGWSEKIFFWMK